MMKRSSGIPHAHEHGAWLWSLTTASSIRFDSELGPCALCSSPQLTSTLSEMSPSAYLDIFIGNQDEHDRAQAAYDATVALLAKNAAIYGLAPSPAALSEEQQGILRDLDVHPRPPRPRAPR